MKTKRTVRVLAVILALTMMPLWMFGCGKLNGDVLSSLANSMVGDGKLDTENSATKAYIDSLDTDVKNLEMRFSGGTWPKSMLTGSDDQRAQHCRNIYTLTKAWATKGSTYYHSGDILDKVKTALASTFVTEPVYGKEVTVGEKCEASEFLVRTLVILADAGKVKGELLEGCTDSLYQLHSVPSGDGSDYVRGLYICIATAALRGDDESIVTLMERFAPKAIDIVLSGNGLRSDGSYLEREIASNLSYGVISFGILVEIATAVSGTEIDFAAELGVQDFLYTWATKSVIPSLYNGLAFVNTVGSYVQNVDEMGGLAVGGLLGLAELLDETRAAEIKAIVKGYCDSNNTSFASGFTPCAASRYQKIAKDEKLTGTAIKGAYAYSEMDKLNVLGNKYSAALSISSNRSVKYETRRIRNEELVLEEGGVNSNGWYTGDGMLILYTNEYRINARYWQFVNAKRIPGTTVDNRNRTPAEDGNFDGVTSYAGSAVIGDNAVSSYFFINNNSEFLSDLTAKKSYFFFDDKIVALGAGITNTTVDNKVLDQKIETVIENVQYGTGTSVAISFDDDLIMSANTINNAPQAMYVMKYGGIYVPDDKNDALFCRINSTDNGKLNFFELWIDHGMTPEKATYEYVIVPSSAKKLNGFFEFVEAPTYEVLANTESVQAVKDTETGMVGYTFWEGAECNGIKTDFACNMMVETKDSGMTIALSDFTHFGAGNKDGGSITLTGSYSLKNSPAGVTMNGNVLTIDRAVAANGQTIVIELG